MEFSRHTDARAERLHQIAAALCSLYPPTSQALPPIIAERLEWLERLERVQRARAHLTGNDQ